MPTNGSQRCPPPRPPTAPPWAAPGAASPRKTPQRRPHLLPGQVRIEARRVRKVLVLIEAAARVQLDAELPELGHGAGMQ